MLKLALATSAAFALLLGVAPATSAGDAPGASGLRVVDRIAGPDGGWDYASFDPAHGRVYVAHGTVVLALDVASGKLDPNFSAGAGLHEVLPIPGTDELLTTNSKDNTAKIISAKDGHLITALTVAADADGAAWDPATKMAVVINGDAGVLTLVDVAARKVAGTITVGGALEFGQPDGKGRFFVNEEDKGAVAVVDLKARKVVGAYPMADCKRPTGLAYVAGDRVISSCNQLAKVLDANTGKEIASLPIGGFPDSVIYDPERGLALVPTALDGKLNVIALSGPQNNQIIDKVPTQIGARTGAVDPRTGRVYLPTAEYNLPVPAGQRPTTKPGTFTVLVLDRK
jgi:DNA-binding beta-propeller fold protein YncE